uniref:Uncharacterized protein n=1 Tax=Arundo donax TaxID=35708 RepID=A0A0A9CM06_ARUDO
MLCNWNLHSMQACSPSLEENPTQIVNTRQQKDLSSHSLSH